MPTLSAGKNPTKEHYNSLKDFESKSDSYYFKRRALQLMAFFDGVPKTAAVLNLGCGDGMFSRLLMSQGFSNIVDLDISVSLLRRSASPLRVLAAAESLPFREKKFDAIIMTDVIEHVNSRKHTVAELSRVLKKCARVFVTYPNPFWVPLFNFLGRTGIKVDARDSKVHRKEFEREIRDFFEVDSLKTIMLISKLPSSALSAFERIEARLPSKFMHRLGLAHVYILRKR